MNRLGQRERTFLDHIKRYTLQKRGRLASYASDQGKGERLKDQNQYFT